MSFPNRAAQIKAELKYKGQEMGLRETATSAAISGAFDFLNGILDRRSKQQMQNQAFGNLGDGSFYDDTKLGDQRCSYDTAKKVEAMLDRLGIYTTLCYNEENEFPANIIPITDENQEEYASDDGEYLYVLQYGSKICNADLILQIAEQKEYPSSLRLSRIMLEFGINGGDITTLPKVQELTNTALEPFVNV